MLRTGLISNIGMKKSPIGGGLVPLAQILLSDSGAGAVNLIGSVGVGLGAASFTRATNAAARLANGLWKLDIANGVARSHYSPTSLYLGYLFELAATQLALNPRDMTQAAWIPVTMTTAQTSTGIDGVANSCTRITATGANATILQTLVAAASSRTNSCFVKRVTGVGTVILKQGTATLDITALINSTTFTQVQLNDNELNVAYGLQINTSGDALDVDCNQFEAGNGATTPIPAGGVRNTDTLQYAFTPIVQGIGSMYAEMAFASKVDVSLTIPVISLDDGAAVNFCQLRYLYNNPAAVIDGVITNTGTQADFVGKVAGITVDTVYRTAMAWQLNDMGFCVTTIAAEQDSVGTPPTATTRFVFGAQANSSSCAKNVRIWPSRLSNSQLQVMTN